jgi:hypothetical protein
VLTRKRGRDTFLELVTVPSHDAISYQKQGVSPYPFYFSQLLNGQRWPLN